MSIPLYLNSTAPTPDRVKDLVCRLTLEEKVGQLGYEAPAIPRLGIPPYTFWNEALHGVARNGRATVFPQAIGMAATWDVELVRAIAAAIGDEARAKYHQVLRSQGNSGWYQGLTFWTPNINIFRDPRWGRGQETWGEDPFLTGEMGAAFVRGLQGDDPRYLKAAACAKHFAVHSGPESSRHSFDARVSLHDLWDTYLPAFRKLVVEAGVEGVMGAYNQVLGEPCCASQMLLVDILRGAWSFHGHVVSDCGALSDIHASHQITQDAAESAALAIHRGCDLACDHVYGALPEALERDLVTEAEIDQAVERVLATRFKLGMFDPPENVPYASIPPEVIGCPAHKELAYQAALKSIVLLKNDHQLLPLRSDLRTIMVVGPNAANLDVLLGNYAGVSNQMTTLLEGIVAAAPPAARIEYRPAVPLKHPIENLSRWTGSEGAGADVTIACLGLSPWLEGEEGDAILSHSGDRDEIRLPEVQVDYLKRLRLYGGKTVLLVAGGSAIDLSAAEQLVDAILFIWYPGQEGGRAIADLLFGKQAPSGKLPVSFPRSLQDLPPFDDYDMSCRTYRYSPIEPRYPFGFGLSYTSFAYQNLQVEGDKVHFRVKNTGAVKAGEVAQLYISPLDSPVLAPRWKLIGFRRVELGPGEACQLEFRLTPDMLAVIDEQGQAIQPGGRYRLAAGGWSPCETYPVAISIEFQVT